MASPMFRTGESPADSLPTRWNAFAQKHAKWIFFGSSLLIVITVVIVANYYWQKSRTDTGMAAVAGATSVEGLEKIRDEYRDIPEVHAHLLYSLAGRYYEEGQLQKALDTYRDFLNLYHEHFLAGSARRGVNSLEIDRKFEEDHSIGLAREYTLYGHPASREPGVSRFGPGIERRPIVSLESSVTGETGPPSPAKLVIELFEDVAPNSVAHVVELFKGKYFENVRWARSDQEGILKTGPRENPISGKLKPEDSDVPVEMGTVFLVRIEDQEFNHVGRLQIALRDLPDLQGRVTVVGQVISLREELDSLKEGDGITALTVERPEKPEHQAEILPDQ